MIALIQRVTHGRVTVDGARIGAIGRGLVALVCAERDDGEAQADALARKVLGYRVFGDEQGRMNLSVRDVDGGLLAVPQFTLAADTRSGARPGFSPAAAPERGERLFNCFVEQARAQHRCVETGRFGAHMQVELINDGPVTFWLQVRAKEEER
ncbi:MAG TPA: D-aminoacyl-tRNA deacylase [Burkholderiaceae bacterium]|nr:D-aminoacyl-tRNA deacylase [Burkholderiaceae bacterium]